MGLDVSHDAFSGAYSSFNRFRQMICKATGGSWPPHEDKALDEKRFYVGDGYTEESHPGLWEFLMHSDCDGNISPRMCKFVANDLESLLPKIEELTSRYGDGGGHIARDGGYVEVTKRFIAGCRLANKRRQLLKFH